MFQVGTHLITNAITPNKSLKTKVPPPLKINLIYLKSLFVFFYFKGYGIETATPVEKGESDNHLVKKQKTHLIITTTFPSVLVLLLHRPY